MSEDIVIKVEDLKRVFILMEKINEFFHQPMNFQNVEIFAKENYKEINHLYYRVLYDLLPPALKAEIDER